VDASNNAFVAEYANNRIQKFTDTGAFIMKWGSTGTGNGQFNGAYGISVDANGNVFVADSINNRVQKFDNNGVFLTAWGSTGSGNGQFSNPRGLAVDANGNVFVSEIGNGRVQTPPRSRRTPTAEPSSRRGRPARSASSPTLAATSS
jgi:DNA-binding beta-propeller fold protein YncE